MTVAGAAVLPSAPLLVPGVAATLPDGVEAVCDAVDAVIERLPDHDAAVLLAAGDSWALHRRADADLAEIGRPDVERRGTVDGWLLDRLGTTCGWPVLDGRLPPDLAVLVLLLGNPPPLVAVSVPAGAGFAELAEAGSTLAEVVASSAARTVVVVPGDLAAGLGERSPLYEVEGAGEFDACVVEAVDACRLDSLSRLGPERAQRVGARAWAPLAVLHGVQVRSKLGLVRRVYAAPRGVGYLVAYGA